MSKEPKSIIIAITVQKAYHIFHVSVFVTSMHQLKPTMINMKFKIRVVYFDLLAFWR